MMRPTALPVHVEGIPLALELAAARLRSLSIDEINKRLHDRFNLLIGGSRVALERQQTLRALVGWSYDLLKESEKIVPVARVGGSERVDQHHRGDGTVKLALQKR